MLFPIVSEAVRGTTLTIGPPYFSFFLRVFGLPLLLLMGIGPIVAWRRASLRSVGRASLALRLSRCSSGAGLLLAPGAVRRSGPARVHRAFVLASISLEFAGGTLRGGPAPAPGPARSRRSSRRTGAATAARRPRDRPARHRDRRPSAYQTVAEVQARPGQTFAVGDYVLRHEGVERRQAANATETRATLVVARDGRDLGEIHPGKNRYPVEDQVSNEVAIRSDLVTGEDTP